MLDEIKGLIEAQTNQISDRFGQIEAKMDTQDSRLRDMEQSSYRRVTAPMPGLEDYTKEFSFMRSIRAISTGDWTGAGFEKEVFEQAQKRTTMTVGSDTGGGYIVPNELLGDFIELLLAKVAVAQMGATILTGLSGSPVEVPKQTGGATAYWIGETESITESDLTFGQIQMTPKSVAALVKLSNRLIRMSNPAAEGMVRRDIQTRIALAIDLACLRGGGVSNEPTGVGNTTGINTKVMGTNGGNITWDDLRDMEYELEVDNAAFGRLGFIFHPAIRRKLIRLKTAQYSGDTGGSYIITPTSEEELKTWLGYPYATTTQLPINLTKGNATDCTQIFFGNWEEFIIGQWGGLEIMASQETSTAFQTNQTWIRIIQDVDFAVRHPESFCVCADAKTGV
jgi:HK97 family phage major capsid protein